jgi:putative tryptophan/tyrosine transport system substrate-binding protein
MKRREFIALICAGVGFPLSARAQQAGIPVIGFLQLTSLELTRKNLASFRLGLGETGYIEGKNVAIEYRWAEGRNDQLATLAAELVRDQVSVIVVTGEHTGRTCRQSGNPNDPDHFYASCRSSSDWPCRQSQSARQKSYRHQSHVGRSGWKAP